ncbi:MAG: DUF6580 family putative transport protein [Bacteroidota bacterium]
MFLHKKNGWLLFGLIFLAAGARLLPHPPNFVPTGAMALFGAAALPKRWLAVLVPLAAYYLSDLVLNNVVYAEYFEGFYWGISPWIYGAVVLMVLLGMGLLRNRRFSWLRIGGGPGGPPSFFSPDPNFGVWAGGTMYPRTLTGLGMAYVAGLPFLLNSLLANLVFSGVLFGIARGVGLLDQPATASVHA